MTRNRTLAATVALVVLCGLAGFGGRWLGPGHAIANPGAQVHASVVDLQGRPLAGVETWVLRADGRRVMSRLTGPDGSAWLTLPARAGQYLVVSALPDGHTDHHDSDGGTPVPATAGCPSLHRCVLLTVDDRGTVVPFEPGRDASAVEFVFAPPVAVQTGGVAAATAAAYVEIVDVTNGGRTPLRQGTIGVSLDGQPRRNRTLSESSLQVYAGTSAQLWFTPPAGYEVVGGDYAIVTARPGLQTVVFAARRITTADQTTSTTSTTTTTVPSPDATRERPATEPVDRDQQTRYDVPGQLRSTDPIELRLEQQD